MTLNTVYALLTEIRVNIIVYSLKLRIRIKVRLGFGLRLAFLKKLCENNEHQKLAYNMGNKFEVRAGKQKTCRLVIRDSQAACYS